MLPQPVCKTNGAVFREFRSKWHHGYNEHEYCVENDVMQPFNITGYNELT